MNVIVRTHGGLGNQIFQILFGRLLANSIGGSLEIIHDSKYYHNFQLAPQFYDLSNRSNLLSLTVSFLRLPKLIYKFLKINLDYVKLHNTYYCDSYFQNQLSFANFELIDIKKELIYLKSILGLNVESPLGTLVHLRLGDFFLNKELALEHAIKRISDCPIGADIITNDNSIINNKEIYDLINNKKCRFISTQEFQPLQVLQTMCKYSEIDANESTLVFWASVFTGAKVEFTSNNLHSLQLLLRSAISTK